MKPTKPTTKIPVMTQAILDKATNNKSNQLGVGFGGEAPAKPLAKALIKAKLK